MSRRRLQLVNSHADGVGEVSIINITIASSSYQAESGMTWKEWCDSDYKNIDFVMAVTKIKDGKVYNNYPANYLYYKSVSPSVVVLAEDKIIDGGVYDFNK